MKSFADQGYEIHVGENEVMLVDRQLWGPACAIVGLSGAAGALLVLALLLALGVGEARSDVAAFGLLAGTAVLLLEVMLLRRRFNERRRLPVDEVRHVLVVDRSSSALRSRMGEILAQLDDVRVSMHVDWMTRGLARLVMLRWPGGRRVVFRSFRRKRALRALELLVEAGITSR